MTIALICLVISNYKSWKLGRRAGISGTLKDLHKQGVFQYLEE